MKKNIVFAIIASMIFCGNTSTAFAASNVQKDNIIVIDNEYSDTLRQEVSQDILDGNNIYSYTGNEHFKTSVENIYSININKLNDEKIVRDQTNKLVNGHEKVYLYGDDLKISEIESLLAMNIDGLEESNTIESDTDIQEESWNVIGIENGIATYFAHIQSYDYNDNVKSPELDNYIDTIIAGKDMMKEINNKNIYDEVQVLANTRSSSIVHSFYGIVDRLYRDDASGNSILRATLTADYILFKNSADQDPFYDYFALKNNVQLYTNTSKGALGYRIIATHGLSRAADNLTDWGPKSTNNNSSFTVSLPWGISWSFGNANDIDIETTGSLTTDSVVYKASNTNAPFGDYPFNDDYVTIQPGTAWASASSSLATINTMASADVKYGTTTYTLSVRHNLVYSY